MQVVRLLCRNKPNTSSNHSTCNWFSCAMSIRYLDACKSSNTRRSTCACCLRVKQHKLADVEQAMGKCKGFADAMQTQTTDLHIAAGELEQSLFVPSKAPSALFAAREKPSFPPIFARTLPPSKSHSPPPFLARHSSQSHPPLNDAISRYSLLTFQLSVLLCFVMT